MTTERQIAANRRNAQKSTGPRAARARPLPAAMFAFRRFEPRLGVQSFE